MCLNVLVVDPKSGKVTRKKKQCERCKAEGRRCRSEEYAAKQQADEK